ncbi:PepSY-associated TM helix domain-containing protein [Novosphingobium sp. MBES04]|uniref:PepSY-associated TM helix domain-containing protein n=1 Tax=Novosphingobium sp. MBES04 TaxID=1206458 RepID=UPI000694A785|nr:PepSY-associated TM helix domain-containing protein [Novosphingobium sp. MBES04]
MKNSTLRAWDVVHTWSSLVCTAFLVMLCLTGLPLIFHDEIDVLSEGTPDVGMPGVASSGEASGLLPLDRMLQIALSARPGEVPTFMAFDNIQPLMTVTTAPRPDSPGADMTVMVLDRSTGKLVSALDESGIMHFLLQLHTDMFLGLGGMLFLGAMGLLFAVAVISGLVLYTPFMRKLAFGSLRTSRSRRVKWLDYHNLLGIVALAWTLVVGLTGVVNTFAEPINASWKATELARMISTYSGQAALAPADYGSLDDAMAKARKALPGRNPHFIGFPGGNYSSGHHYGIFFQGGSPLTEHLLTVALIDARTGALTASAPMPWYAKALALSQPLHFGDYGGLPLKIIWALLNIFTLVILGSGLYLWLARRRSRRSGEDGRSTLPLTREALR